MKMDVSIKLDLKTEEVKQAVEQAAREGLRDVTGEVATDAIEHSPKITGYNALSIKYEVSGIGQNEVVDPNKIQSAVYSTSGYGGYLEVGTEPHVIRVKTAKVLTDGKTFFGKEVNHPGTKPHPYFKPALDRNFTRDNLVEAIKRHLE